MSLTVGVQKAVFEGLALAEKLHELYYLAACLIVSAAA